MDALGRNLSVVMLACAGALVQSCSGPAQSGSGWSYSDDGGANGSTASQQAKNDGSPSGQQGDGSPSAPSSSSSGGSSPGPSSSSGSSVDSSSGRTSSSGSTGSNGSSGGASGRDASTSHDAQSSADVSNPGTGGGDSGSLDSVRQLCVDTINMYRATLNLAPLMRATPSEEACSDMGAMKDGTSMAAHSSAGMCSGFGAQDSCPDLPTSFGQTLESALKQCLAQMWAEGPPPGTVQACIQDYTGCFLQHGHYINMSSSTSTVVSSGFFMMSNGDYWGNQDFN